MFRDTQVSQSSGSKIAMGNAAAASNAAARNAGAFPTRYVRFGAFQLDVQQQDLLKNGERLRLPGKVCQVLITLLERPGEIVTREELRARLWPSDTHVNFDANVNTTVNKLRQILCSADGGRGAGTAAAQEDSVYVQTIPRKGYSFVSKVEFVDRLDAANLASGSEENLAANGVAASAKSAAAPSAKFFDAQSSRFFAAHRAPVWFTAGVIALVVAAMLFGAAITLFSHRI
jgi:DNA-binding winged helix-turn-helix (wHTH) protein